MTSQNALTAAVTIALITFPTAATGTLVAQDRCDFRGQLSAELDIRGGDRLDVEAGSGYLVVEGEPGLDHVRAVAIACASTEELLEALDLVLDRAGLDVRLRTEYPEWRGRRGGERRYARLDLRVEVPRDMELIVQDGSGSMELRGVGDIEVDDGSGDILIEDARSVRIEDGSGNVEVRGVRGAVEVHDGSGAIEVDSAEGPVDLWDGSGEIRVLDAGSDVEVHEDGSGGIDVDGVSGDFTVSRGRAQGIEYSNVQGEVEVPEDRRRRRRPGG